ncbi:MAG: hypothetical protein J0M04_14360 [Verrucomicrobia bacterium]|nr:hypothetical protein [Verrucomicrobiota bacterium]
MPRRLLPLILTVISLRAEDVRFGPAFSSGMMLQREAPVTLTGLGPAGASVNVTLGKTRLTTIVARDGTWKATFPPVGAGGPYPLEISDGKSRASLDDVLAGDIWVCSGQSNMQMGLDEAIGVPEAIANGSSNTTIRLLSVPKAGADKPQTETGATWRKCDPESLRKFSAVAWFFAVHLRKSPRLAEVPIGIVDSSFGGTSIEAWTPPGTLPDMAGDDICGSMFGIPPGSLFNRMISPLTASPIKGVLWYQGEANAGKPLVYPKLLSNLADRWRAAWRQPDLPFLIVQLPAFDGSMGGLDFGWLREAQAKACSATTLMWCAATYDTTDGSDLHPREKEEVGRRLALLARRNVFGEDIISEGPKPTSMDFGDGLASITFDQPPKAAAGGTITGFALAGADGEFRFAKATAEGNRVTLVADGIADPKFVRYAWGGLPNATLTNASGLAAPPFRNDAFPPRSTVFQPLPAFQRVETPLYQLETGRFGRIASLVADGRQFLSNEPNGGAGIPTFFGPRNLPLVRATGPNRLVLSDASAEIEIACHDDTMEWTLRNRGNDPYDFRVMLHPQVRIESGAETVTLTRENVRLTVRGATASPDGGCVETKVPPQGARTLAWSIAK